jgi:LysM repeat protein
MYHVEQGDRLLRIALRFNRTILEIVRANPEITNSQLIYLGQTIKIPDCKTR